MSLLQADTVIVEARALRKENEALRERISELSKASISISERLDTEAVLQEIVNSA